MIETIIDEKVAPIQNTQVSSMPSVLVKQLLIGI